jgi:nucleotide-binding universal stress UspA family protein
VVTELVDDDSAEALLRASRTCRLVVVGARGTGHEFRSRWGSVAAAVSARAAAPVLISRVCTHLDEGPAVERHCGARVSA